MKRLPVSNWADGTAGLPGHMHYDPYFPRLLAHVKRLLAQDIPVLIRLHPGATYPMAEDLLHYRVDREGHVVALIGYDDEKQEFMVADPWNRDRWGGDQGGTTTLSYQDGMMLCVDSSLGATMLMVPWEVTLQASDRMPLNEPFTLTAQVAYPCPEPLSAAENHVSECQADLVLPDGLELVSGVPSKKQLGDGFIRPGDVRSTDWTVVRTSEVNGTIGLRVRGIITNADPYLYTDIVGICGQVEITAKTADGAYEASAPTLPVRSKIAR